MKRALRKIQAHMGGMTLFQAPRYFTSAIFLSIVTAAIQHVRKQRDAAGRFLAEVLRCRHPFNRG